MLTNKPTDCLIFSKIRYSFISLLKNKYILFSAVVMLELGLSFLTGVILDKFFPVAFENKGGIEFNSSLSEELIVAVIVAPILETLFFQVIPIQLVLKYLRSVIFAVLLSAVLFAIQHVYSWIYLIAVLPTSFILAIYYIYSYKKNGGIWAFHVVVLVHAIHNLIAFLA